jgi:hypothetical protein
MTPGVTARAAAEVGRVAENPRWPVMRSQLATLVRGSSATTHCHAAPALLTREYQGDHRRCFLPSVATRALHPVDKYFHISRVMKKPARGLTG